MVVRVQQFNDLLRDVPLHPSPKRFLACPSDVRACQILAALKDRLDDGSVNYAVIDPSDASSNVTTTDVVIVSGDIGKKRFKVELGNAIWAEAAYTVTLGVTAVKAASTISDIALQLLSMFHTHYGRNLESGSLPTPEPEVVLPDMDALLERLHGGPHFGALVNRAHSTSLPPTWPLSFGRVTPRPLHGDAAQLERIVVNAFDAFEAACEPLLEDPLIHQLILQGVDLADERMAACYTRASGVFSVRRLDMVVLDDGNVSVTENDEMPGGFPDAFHHDASYVINQNRWPSALDYLTKDGLLVFLVSSDWGQVYIHEMMWFADHLRDLGYDVQMLSTDQSQRLIITPDGVYYNAQPVATIWRQFPIFEAQGHVAELVLAAEKGLVKLVPQFSSLGNKVWFSVFWDYQTHFKNLIEPDVFELLRTVIPYSETATSAADFPRTMLLPDGEMFMIEDLEALMSLPATYRDHLVLKSGGANRRSARMYGVIVGNGTSGLKWRQGVADMFAAGSPVIFQRFRSPKVHKLPVLSVLGDTPVAENLEVKVLVRPWKIGPSLVSMTGFAVPGTNKLHGTSNGCQVPAALF